MPDEAQGTKLATIAEPVAPSRRSTRIDWTFRYTASYRIAWGVLALVLVFAAIAAPAVLNSASLRLVTALAGVLIIVCIGELLTVVSGGLDLSIPAVVALSGAATVKLSQGSDSNLLGLIATVLAIGAVVGAVNGILIAVLQLNALIVTLSMSTVIAGGTLVWAGSNFSATGFVPQSIADFSAKHIGPINIIVVVALVLAVVAYLVVSRTVVGRRFVAVGTSPQAARSLGISVRGYQAGAYVVAGVLYALGGLLVAGYVVSPDLSLGSPYLLTPLAAVALAGASLGGGPASISSVVAACLALTLVTQTLSVLGTGGGLQSLVQGLILVGAVAAATSNSWGRRIRRPSLRSLKSMTSPRGKGQK
jgi:ribose transport system permease protein